MRLIHDERGLAQREKILLSVLGIVAVGALGYTALGTGGGPPPALELPPNLTRPTPTPDLDGGGGPPTTGDVFVGRDPFEPLIDMNPGGNGGDGGNGSNGGGGNGTNGGNGSEKPVSNGDGDTIVVALVDVFTTDGDRQATVRVDGKLITVSPGDTFAQSFKLLSLTKKCGEFLFGDESFRLCIGQEVRK